VIPQQSWIDYASLAFGVTTLHDPSNDTSEIFTHSEMQRTAGGGSADLLDRDDPVRREGLYTATIDNLGRRGLAPPGA
jgi:hypothetical protein